MAESNNTPGSGTEPTNAELESAEGTGAPDQEMEEFLAHLNQHMPREGEQPQGGVFEVTVVAVDEKGVVIDVGGKEEATLGLDEFPKIGDKPGVKVGDTIQVIKLGRGTGEGGARYSHREARIRASLAGVQAAFTEKRALKGRVLQVVKGGLMVDCGIPSFMPASQIDLFKIPDLNALVGQDIEAYIIEYDAKRRRAVLSRRQLLFERRENERKRVLEGLAAGSTIKGKVKSALEFGIFVELGGIDGFIPREEVSFDRGTPPARIVQVGSEIECVVTKVDMDKGKVTLSRKRALPDPWTGAELRYRVGDVIQGTVVSIQDYGAFVHLEEGVTGMIHASDMSWALGNKKPADFVKVDVPVTAQILEVDREKRRISMGLKQLTTDPWAEVEARYAPGTRVKGTINSLTNYGAFVKIDEFLEGMIHVSDIVWERRLNHPKEILQVGQEVEAVVLKADRENRRLSLGIKQLQKSPYEAYMAEHPQGSVATGKVTRFAPFGAFVELADGLEGLIHISQIDIKRVELPENVLKVGDEVQVKILKYETKNRKISLSRKEAIRHAEREEIKQYMGKSKPRAEDKLNSFGEALRAAQEEAEREE